ncbi:glycosyl transferase [Gammaproteobacteria bacterium 45_16_T64]|nr:glycosyl transferase [Gammaproteobacteria bacterium 45_16_T64]
MKVDTMRVIDRWTGIPLTFLLTLILKPWERFMLRRNRGSQPDVSRTLFIELSEMGSAIIVDPAMKKLKAERNAELFFVIFEDNAKSLNILGTIPKENIFTMRVNSLANLAIDIFRFMAWCREKRITTCIDLELFSRFTALLSAVSGAASRIGYSTHHDEGCYRGDLITHPVRYNAHTHIVKNFMALTNTALGLNNKDYSTYPINDNEIVLDQVTSTESELDSVREKITTIYPDFKNQRIVLINPNASELLPQRRWLAEYFAEVMTALLNTHDDILIMITGAPAERADADKLLRQVNHARCVNSAGVFTFEELLPLYQLSTVMLTNDSGPGHFSAVTPLKVYVLFGPETPALYGSLGNAENFYLALPCSPCVSAHNHRKTSCVERPCITGIKPKPVFDRINTYLTQIPTQSI